MTPLSSVTSCPSLRPRRAAALALLLAVTGAGGPALAQAYPSNGTSVPSQPYRDSWRAQQGQAPTPAWAGRKRQEVEVITGFSPQQRREYFEARRDLERRQADQEISQLNVAERCLDRAREAQAVQTCLQQERQQRIQQQRQNRSDLSQLHQRFGLPALPERRWKGSSGRQEVEAITGFSPQQRREYFEARRGLERRQADEEIRLLNATERCLDQAREAQAVQICLQQQRQQGMQQQRQNRSDLSQLRQRFGLPALPQRRLKGASGGKGSWGPRPMPYNGTPQT